MGFTLGMVVMFLPAAEDPTKDAAKSDLEKLQGSWVLVGGEEKGMVLSEEDARKEKWSLVIKDDKFTITRGKNSGTCMIRLNPIKKPAWMDLVFTKDGKEVNHAIYALDGDRLIICYSRKSNPNSPEERPAKFTTKREDNNNLRGLCMDIYKRQKK
jgi:uncharacterized protein (TIGR03067 family)